MLVGLGSIEWLDWLLEPKSIHVVHPVFDCDLKLCHCPCSVRVALPTAVSSDKFLIPYALVPPIPERPLPPITLNRCTLEKRWLAREPKGEPILYEVLFSLERCVSDGVRSIVQETAFLKYSDGLLRVCSGSRLWTQGIIPNYRFSLQATSCRSRIAACWNKYTMKRISPR